jgi:hypothetical protein
MNKAFVREADDERASNPLPDRPIPAEPNLVTPEGLAHIQEMVDLAQGQHTAARDAGDANEVARTERDLRYWMARQATAQVTALTVATVSSRRAGRLLALTAMLLMRGDDIVYELRVPFWATSPP